jgi:ankyrin repeat protein
MLQAVRELRSKDVEALLEEDSGLLSYRDDRGRNWLHICCSVNVSETKLPPGQSLRTAHVLLQAGLDVNQEAFSENNWRATPLWYAIARGQNLMLARHLLERGSDPNHCLWAAAYSDDVEAIELLVKRGADIDPVTEDETPFLSAVKQSHFQAAEVLLAHGANVNFQDSHGRSALHYMLKKGSDARHFLTMIRYGARGDLKDAEGHMPAEIMSRKRDPEFRRLCSRLAIGDDAGAPKRPNSRSSGGAKARAVQRGVRHGK